MEPVWCSGSLGVVFGGICPCIYLPVDQQDGNSSLLLPLRLLCHEGLKPSKIWARRSLSSLQLLMPGTGWQQVETTESQNVFNMPCSCVFPRSRRKLVILLSSSEVIPCHPCHASCLPRETPTQLSQAWIGLFYPAAKPVMMGIVAYKHFTSFSDSAGLKVGTAHCLRPCPVLN